ncbi:hypothetical protein MHYP_G00133070 [Metynnis hypsauchen]
MIRVLLPITVSFLWLTDSVFSNNVQQSPLDLIKNNGDSVEIQCLHNIPNYNVILWYKKNAVQEFVLLGYLWDDQTYNQQGSVCCVGLSILRTNMKRLIIVLIVFLHCPPGLSDVIQTPKRIFALAGHSVNLNCSHTLDSNYYQMYWYQQREQESLTLIVFTMTNSKPDFGTFSKEKYSAEKKHYSSGSFTVKNLTADDSGSYFCVAAKHSDRDQWNS